MKRGWLALVMLVPMLAGCLSGPDDSDDSTGGPPDVGYNAKALEVTGVVTHELEIPSDNITLSAILYEPLTRDSVDGAEPQWPLVVFVHPWGFPKETYENAPLSSRGSPSGPSGDGAPSEEDDPRTNLMQRFAEAGIMGISYDTRGWGQSGGESTVAGPAEMRDLRAVIDYANEHFLTNGRTGVVGHSYGGGHAYNAWAWFDDVITASPHNGWVDLYDGVFPGNVPKLEWGAELTAFGAIGGGPGEGTSPIIYDWMGTSFNRQDETSMDGIHRQLDTRSILQRGVQSTDKPLFVCSAIGDTLFNQNHRAWLEAPNDQVYAYYHPGGHNTLDAECWDRTLDWFQFHLAGIDTGVTDWPFLETVDLADPETSRTYSKVLATSIDHTPLFFREEQLVTYADAKRTFTIRQQGGSNPFIEPSTIYESTGQSNQEVPEQFREDPSGILFRSADIEGTSTVLGSPTITLVLANETEAPFQVVATLYRRSAEGTLLLLGHGATNPLGPGHLDSTGTANITTIQMPWMKLDMLPGESFVVELSSSEPSIYAPYLGDFEASFTGESSIDIPFFGPPALGG